MNFKYFYLKENEESFNTKILDTFVSFSKKVQYAKSKLKKLGEGSSRVVFELPDNKVLKLAKNKSGIDQNMADGDYGKHSMYPDLIPEVFDNDEDGYWIIVKAAQKITEKEFENLTKINFKTFERTINEYYLYLNGKRNKLSDETQKLVDDNEFFQTVSNLMGNFDLLPGDLGKINSWGKINNNPVIIDTGLTEEVFRTHYKRK